MRQRNVLFSPRWLLGLGVVLAALLTACGPFGGPSITTPSDTSAYNLDMAFSLGTAQYPDKLAVGVIVSYQGVPVRFARGEHLVCDGVALRFETNAFSAYIPVPPKNQQTNCTYVDARGVPTSIAFATAAQPVILSPQAGAAVVRSKSFTVTYAPQAVQQVQLDMETYLTADKATGLGCVSQQITGAIPCDNTKIPPGHGKLLLNMQMNTKLVNSGFHSASTNSDVVTKIDITWI